MSRKARIWLVIIFFLCLLVIGIFLILRQIYLLYEIALTYWIVCTLLWGGLFISSGMKHLRQEGRPLRWNRNPLILIGMGIGLPPLLGLGQHLWGRDIIGHTGMWIIDLMEIILVSVLLVFLLFFEVVLTAGFLRSLLKRPLVDRSSEERSSEKHSPEENRIL